MPQKLKPSSLAVDFMKCVWFESSVIFDRHRQYSQQDLIEEPCGLRSRWNNLQMLVSRFGCFASARGAFNISLLNQEWLIHFFNGLRLFANSCSNGRESNWSTFEFFNDRTEDTDVHIIQSIFINIQCFQCQLCN